MRDLKKEKGFTLIELWIVLAIVIVLAMVIVPSTMGLHKKAKQTGVEHNKRLIEMYASIEYEKTDLTDISNTAIAGTVFNNLSKNTDVNTMVNPLNKQQKGIGYINGTTYDNSNKAAYVFTDNPVVAGIPEGVVFVVIKNGIVTSGNN